MERCLFGARRLEGRDVLPDDERAGDRVPVPDRRGRGQDVDRPAVRGRDRDRDVDRLLAGQRAGRGQLLRREERAVGAAVAEDRDDIGGGAPGERPAGEGLGHVVRGGDPAVGAVEERGLPDSSERQSELIGHETARGVSSESFPLEVKNDCHPAAEPVSGGRCRGGATAPRRPARRLVAAAA